MKKELRVFDTDSGEILEELNFDGGYNITITNLSDGGNIRKLDNGKFGYKHWIKNYQYRSTALINSRN